MTINICAITFIIGFVIGFVVATAVAILAD